MKKTKLLIGTLVLSMGLMGTGYAYWTKQLTVNTTVKSANFDVYFSAQSATQSGNCGVDNKHNTVTGSLKDSSNRSTLKGTKVEYNWENIYPGSEATFKYTITSESTIPVWAEPKYELSGDTTLAEKLTFTVDNKIYNGFTAFKSAMESNKLELAKASLSNPISKDYTVKISFDKSVTDLNTANNSLSFTIDMNWKQFNDTPVATPTPSLPPTRPGDDRPHRGN